MSKLLQSPRFLAVSISAIVIGVLQSMVLFNVISSVQGEGLVLIVQSVIASITGIAVTIKTFDRSSDKRVIAAGVASDQIAVSSVTKVPPKED